MEDELKMALCEIVGKTENMCKELKRDMIGHICVLILALIIYIYLSICGVI